MLKSFIIAVTLGKPDTLGLPEITLEKGLSSIISIVFSIIGALSVAFVVYGGLKYTLSGGEPAGIKKAKETIIYAVVGIVVSLLAFGIVNFVTGRF